MERGLLWFALLGFFCWLTWAGWREFQKVGAYQTWASSFDRAKYDIYAVLGQKGSELTWGIPTGKGPVNLETFSLTAVNAIHLLVNGQPADWENPPSKGRAELEFICGDRPTPIRIPFTEPSLAAKWGHHLQQEWQRLS
jgi:hypothetical protein